jgi:MerR family redox-sensitive transcriptional activator SoxR
MDCKDHLMTADELINIREMSERSSVSASTLRYYEKLGLITSERGRSGSHRRYSESTFHRVIYITLAQRAGFSLEEIAEQLAILPNIHPIPPKVWEPLRKKWEQRIDQHISELKQLKVDLRRCTRDASRWALRPLAATATLPKRTALPASTRAQFTLAGSAGGLYE